MRIFAAAFVAAMAVSLGGCGKSTPQPREPIALVAAPESPAAQGRVHVAPASNGNTDLVVEVRHVAPPEKVAPGASTYVVWVQPSGGDPQNVGALTVDKDLQGSLRTLTPLKDFELFITAEPNAQAQAPSGTRVLSTRIDQD